MIISPVVLFTNAQVERRLSVFTQTEVQKLIVSHFAGKYPFMEKSLNRLMEVIVDS